MWWFDALLLLYFIFFHICYNFLKGSLHILHINVCLLAASSRATLGFILLFFTDAVALLKNKVSVMCYIGDVTY